MLDDGPLCPKLGATGVGARGFGAPCGALWQRPARARWVPADPVGFCGGVLGGPWAPCPFAPWWGVVGWGALGWVRAVAREGAPPGTHKAAHYVTIM